ncbi:hypothetical protein TREMEDRAFT_64055 [Tremella mesenterica DSM 1558]|uniref:uncharacterized protein n=1 Tax=Tremella mesenterica (strain ATCC 24925 / CBS 8224 / DSM 1558 / NBRC 9311 / NRRL Y-6157 / RJB 2259-6 / UBC 559-6) TaxID=578456 RepID=UPI0003F4A011|nr:uncharacterized protein TREMEDRAFT_64055 [Tremella mesenterica DSM 1558]EIW67464.1 hypothetical protein TREMEDRAFT_64055 [Tremella mesenterica DSM 1558]
MRTRTWIHLRPVQTQVFLDEKLDSNPGKTGNVLSHTAVLDRNTLMGPLLINWAAVRSRSQNVKLRNYNNSLAFTSMGVDKQDMQVWGPQGIYTFRIGGRAYHQIGALLPEAGEHPRFAQVFLAGLSEAEQAAQRNIHIRGRGEEGVLTRLAQMIERVNPYYAAFKTFRDRDRESEEDTPILYLTILNPLQNDPRRYNRPTSDEVACVYVTDENEPSPGRHIQVYLRGGGVRNISELHSAYLPLHFTLIYPHGEPGWHPRIPLAGQPLGDDDEIDAMGVEDLSE